MRSPLLNHHGFLAAARKTPLSQRPQAWWDTLSILGGAACGYLWFLYGSVRGLSLCAPLSNLLARAPGRTGAFLNGIANLIPSFVILALPLILFLLRRPLLARVQPLKTGLMAMTPGRRLGIGIPSALLGWLLLSRGFFLFRPREGLDFITPILMTALPLLLVLFRKETDRLLQPIQRYRRALPRPLLLGIGLAIPFLTAFLLYRGVGLSQYPLLRTNVVLGTLLSYAVLRTPAAFPGRLPLSPVGLVRCLIWLFILWAPSVWADDFLRDPFNLNDGLRTPGWAPVLAGVATATVTMLVNGVEVVRVIIQGTEPVKPGEEPERKNFTVVVRTLDPQGQTSTLLRSGEAEALFVFAHCEEIGKGRFPQGDSTIQFSLLSAQDWVDLQDLGTQSGERCGRLMFKPDLPLGQNPPVTATIHVSAGAGELVSADIPIDLALDLQLSAEVVNGEKALGGQEAYPVFVVRFDKASKQWKLGEVVIYFHAPRSETPVKPSFVPAWDKVTGAPDYLDFDTPLSDDGNLTWRIHPKVRQGIQLPDDWLLSGGKVVLTISCKEQGPMA